MIVPCRGPAPWLPQALDSVLAEGPSEVVVVDDGSDLPFGLAERHADVRLVRRPIAGGPAAARQTGFDQLSHEWIALCDADDEWLPGRLAAQEPLTAHADVIAGPVELIGPDGQAIDEVAPVLGTLDVEDIFTRVPIVPSTVLMRRRAVEAAGGFTGIHVHRGEDLDLWLRMAADGARFAAADRPLARHRRSPGSLSDDRAEVAHDRLIVREAHAALVPPAVAASVRARDLRTLGHGRARERRWREARLALEEAARLDPSDRRERAAALAVRIPGLRKVLARGDDHVG